MLTGDSLDHADYIPYPSDASQSFAGAPGG
jgi:hypothetical protein